MACNFNPTEDRVSLEASHLCFNDWVCVNENPRVNKSSFSWKIRKPSYALLMINNSVGRVIMRMKKGRRFFKQFFSFA